MNQNTLHVLTKDKDSSLSLKQFKFEDEDDDLVSFNNPPKKVVIKMTASRTLE
jgi:hypothetical protein